MVNLVIVSHSHELAQGVKELIQQMIPNKEIKVEAVGGTDDGGIGTSMEKISKAINSCLNEDGVLVLMDLGSAVMTAEMCLEMIPEEARKKVKLSNAPIVEGAIAAAGASVQGLSLDEVEKAANETKLTNKIDSGTDTEQTNAADESEFLSTFVKVKNKTGLHARPASMFVETASAFKSEVRLKNISANKPSVNAKSIMEVATSGTANQGEWIKIMAKGEDAKECLKTLESLVKSGFNEELETDTRQPKHEIPNKFKGQVVNEGYAVGKAFIYKKEKTEPSPHVIEDPDEEIEKLHKALMETKREIARTGKNLGPEEAKIFQFHEMVLSDKKLLSEIESFVKENYVNAEFAVEIVLKRWAQRFRESENKLMKTRDKDILDIKERLLSAISGFKTQKPSFGEDVILITAELLPSDVANIDTDKVKGIAVAFGGTTSHAAIIARTLGIPCLVGLGEGVLSVEPGTRVAIDGDRGELLINPTEEREKNLLSKGEEFYKETEVLLKKANQKAVTKDGFRVEVVANIAEPSNTELLNRLGAEGVGLMRSEFLYINRETPPSFEEEYEAYHTIARAMKNNKVIIRTLDAGGDKNIPYLNLSKEDNPFLGVRAIRLYRKHIDIFEKQIEAIIRANEYGNIAIMIPMIASVDEALWAKEVIDKVYERTKTSWNTKKPGMGIMVEVPSAAILSNALAAHVDFFSIGSNDLTQYTLACDRGNKNLSYMYDPLHPAVLKLIRETINSAHEHGIWCGVCGEMAGDPASMIVLCGMGVDELSMTPASIPRIKEIIRKIKLSEAKDVADKCLNAHSAHQCRSILSEYLKNIQLY